MVVDSILTLHIVLLSEKYCTGNFHCLVALLGVEMHCADGTGTFEAGLSPSCSLCSCKKFLVLGKMKIVYLVM